MKNARFVSMSEITVSIIQDNDIDYCDPGYYTFCVQVTDDLTGAAHREFIGGCDNCDADNFKRSSPYYMDMLDAGRVALTQRRMDLIKRLDAWKHQK